MSCNTCKRHHQNAGGVFSHRQTNEQTSDSPDGKETFTERQKLSVFLAGIVVLAIITAALIGILFNDDGFGGALFPNNSFRATPKVIGVVLPEQETDYNSKLTERIYYDASYYGWSMVLYSSGSSFAEQEAIERLISRNVDAIIFDPNEASVEAIQYIDDLCVDADIPCVMILDEGEAKDCCASCVWCDLEYLGTEIAFSCGKGSACIIQKAPLNRSSASLDKGLLYNEQYGLLSENNRKLIDFMFIADEAKTDGIVKQERLSKPYVDIYIVVNPDLIQNVTYALRQTEYKGNVYCFSNEVISEEVDQGQFLINGFFFAISDISYYSTLAVANQIEHGMQPQSYTVYPYGW